MHGSASGLSVDDATLTLNDDDTASASVSLSVSPASVSEDAGSVSVQVTAELDGAAGLEPTSVNVTVGRTGDSAASRTDYTSVAGFVLTIPARQTTGTATFTLTLDDDEVAERVEEITVHGTASGLTVDDTALTLNDDDTASASVSLSVDPGSVSEDAGSVSVQVTAELDGAAGLEPTSVNVTVGRTGDSAASGTDYTSVADFVLTIPGEQTTGTATFTLTLDDDEVAERVEEITVHGTASGLTVDDATLTLNDDDTASASVSLSVDPGSVSEDAGAVSVQVTAELDGAARLEPTAVNVTVGRTGDSAASGTDYTSVADFVLTIPGEQTTGTATFTLTPEDDEIAESPEEITVHGSASGLSVDDATLTLNDDDQASASVSLSVDPASVSEDAGSVSVQVTAELDGAARLEPTSVNVTVGRTGDSAASGTDYTSVAGFVLTIPGEQTTGTATFTLTPDDDEVAERVEEITVHGTASGLTVDDATLTLNDDDTASASVSLSVDPGSVSEDAGAVSVQVTAELDGAAGLEPTAVNVTVGRTGDSAASGTDYTSVADFVLTIPGEQTTGTATFTLTPEDDEIAESPEEITVHGSASGLTVDDATLTLNDDDQASNSVSLSLSPASVSERDGTVTVEVTAELNAGARPDATAVQVSVGVPGDSATSGTDYDEVPSFILQIPPRTLRAAETFTLRLTDDEVAEGSETIRVSGSAAGLDVEAATLTLQDQGGDVVRVPTLRVSLDPESVTEGDGPAEVLVTVEAAGAPSSQDTRLQLSVGAQGDSATAGTDYEEILDFELIIASGASRGAAAFLLRTLDDEEAEGDDAITVLATLEGANIEPLRATLHLFDNDQKESPGRAEPPSATFDVRIADATASEGAGRMRFRVILDQPAPIPVSVDWSTQPPSGSDADFAEEGADYLGAYGTLEIPAGQAEGSITVSLHDDSADEMDERFEVVLWATSAGVIVDDVAVGTIRDDDGPSLTIRDVSGAESAGLLKFRVSLSAPSVQTVSGRIVTADQTATAGSDYTERDAPFEIAPGGRRFEVRIPITDDALDEADETFLVAVRDVQNATITAGEAVGTIEDDDPAPRLIAAPASAKEDDGELIFDVRLTSPSGLESSVIYATADGTATESADYQGVSGMLIFAPGETFTRVRVRVIADVLDEADETFTLEFSEPTHARIGTFAVTATIEDDDAPPRLSAASASAREDDGEMTFDVRLSGASGREVSTRYATFDRTAHDGADYEGVSQMLTFAPGETSKQVSVTVIPDVLHEADETFTLEFREPTHTDIETTAVVGTIRDDDAEPALRIHDARASEQAGVIAFRATLEAVAGRDLHYSVWTTDGEAVAGEDYDGMRSQLLIPAGEAAALVQVSVLDDNVDETEETFLLTVDGGRVTGTEGRSAIGTIEDDDDNEPVARMLITRFGRAAATHLVEAVDQRMGSDSHGTRFSLGLDPTQTVLQTAHRNAFGDGWQAMRERTGAAGLDPQDLLGRSSFLVQTGTSGAATDEVWTLWGRGATQRFAGEADGISVEGSVLTSTIGFDYRRGGLLAGPRAREQPGDRRVQRRGFGDERFHAGGRREEQALHPEPIRDRPAGRPHRGVGSGRSGPRKVLPWGG